MIELGVNIDHVATLRQARRTYEPDPLAAAFEAQLGGADVLTVHLREDRRHIQDHDLERVAASVPLRLNLEMAATAEMVGIAARVRPAMSTLVPESRREVTTEGGLDVAGQLDRLREVVASLHAAGVCASAFIDADPAQVDAAADAGFDVCEVHTGPYAHALEEQRRDGRHPRVLEQVARVADAGRRIEERGMRFNAGHALNYVNVRAIAGLPALCELHIGHAIVSRAVFVGLRQAVAEMKRAMLDSAPRA